jgi:type VI secretion system secreted protein Hcp
MGVCDYFLKVDGVEGECKDLKHKGELQIASFSKETIVPRDVATGMATGRRFWDAARFSMRMDKSCILLLKKINENALIKSAVLTCRKAGGLDPTTKGQSGKGQSGQEYFKITFSDAFVSKVSMRGSGDSDPTPIVDFALNFSKIEEEYRAQTERGTLGGAITYSDSIGSGT